MKGSIKHRIAGIKKRLPLKRRNKASKEQEKIHMIDLVGQNLETIIEYQMNTERRLDPHQRVIEAITKQIGRPRFLYIILWIVGLWIVINELLIIRGLRAFDPPPYNWLQGLVSLYALIMTSIILITQNRQAKQAEHRRHLDLQVSLLVEQKVTKLIALFEELRNDLPQVRNRYDAQAEAMQEVIDPNAVLHVLEDVLEDEISYMREELEEED